MNMLQVQNLSVEYGHSIIFRDLSFGLNAGDWLMVAGPNGAGKSTLVNALSGALPFSGEITVMGEALRSIRPNVLARRLGVLAQENHVEYDFSVEELVSLGRYSYRRGFFSSEAPEVSMDEVMERTGISHLCGRSALTLSGGELQRVFLAQLLVQDPKILILDEPTSHLDLRFQKELFAIVSEWLKAGDRAVISVVHDLSLALSFGTHSLLMGDGETVFGRSGEVLTAENLNRIYSMNVRDWMLGILSRWESVGDEKTALRRKMKSRQRYLSDRRAAISQTISENVFSLPEYRRAETVFCFVSMDTEPDTDQIILNALGEGKRACVPRITGEGTMDAVEIHSLNDLRPGKYGIREPVNTLNAVDITNIDFALIPCLSCNNRGQRLGRGGGFYDRFLQYFPGNAAVLCPEELMTDSIPTEEHDIPIPIVVTDKTVYRI